MPAHRMFLLEYGAELCPKSWSVLGADDELRWVPVVGIAVETDIGWVVLETGFSRQAVDDREACEVVYGPGHDPRALSGEPFAHALENVGLSVSDVALAAVSHFHIDHTGGLPLLAAAGVPVMVQRKELDFALHRGDIQVAYYRDDYADRGIEWRILDGDTEIAPGITAIFTPGHAPGHMSYRVDLPETGTWIFAVDAADLGQNLFDGVPIGTAADPDDIPRSPQSLQRLRDEAQRLDARLVPGHDPWFWRAVMHPPGGHR
jgi:glyoxylase-like metal-dependent hydrolase (beta-lactamase superfamily II)